MNSPVVTILQGNFVLVQMTFTDELDGTPATPTEITVTIINDDPSMVTPEGDYPTLTFGLEGSGTTIVPGDEGSYSLTFDGSSLSGSCICDVVSDPVGANPRIYPSHQQVPFVMAVPAGTIPS